MYVKNAHCYRDAGYLPPPKNVTPLRPYPGRYFSGGSCPRKSVIMKAVQNSRNVPALL